MRQIRALWFGLFRVRCGCRHPGGGVGVVLFADVEYGCGVADGPEGADDVLPAGVVHGGDVDGFVEVGGAAGGGLAGG